MDHKRKRLVSALLTLGLSTMVAVPASAATLQEVLTQTIATNPDVLINTNERLARDQQVKEARGGYFPSVDVVGGIGRERSKNAGTDDEWKWLTRKEAGIVGNQLIFDGMFTPYEIDRQKARVNSQAYAVNASVQNIIADATDAYLQVLRYRVLVQLAEHNLDVHHKIYDQIKARSESGVGRKADLAQIEARVALAESNLLSEKNNLRDAETNYLRVIGELPQDLEPAPEFVALIPGTEEDAVERALANNATLKSAEADVESARYEYKAAKSTYYPEFNVEVSRNWGENIDGIEGDDDDFRAMLLLNWNLLRGGSDQARVQRTAELVNEAKEIRNRTHREVTQSTRLAWAAYKSADKQKAWLKQYVEQNKVTRDAYQKQFRIGQRTLLDVLNTENELFKSERDKETNNIDWLFAQYRLLRVMSQLNEALEIPLPEEAIPLEEEEKKSGSDEEKASAGEDQTNPEGESAQPQRAEATGQTS